MNCKIFRLVYKTSSSLRKDRLFFILIKTALVYHLAEQGDIIF